MPNTEGCQEHKDTTIKCKIYEEDGSPPPEMPTEICSAVLNRWGFTRLRSASNSDSHSDNIAYNSAVDIAYNIISLKSNEAIHKANTLCKRLYYTTAVKRDYIIYSEA